MNSIILFCAQYLIGIATLYAVVHVIFTSNTKKYLQHIVRILGTACVAWIVAYVLKNIFAFPRPDVARALFVPIDGFSFPSGHATYMFALAWSMYSFDRRAGIFLFILAFITGVARVLAGVHYWYDIVGGFVLGLLVAVSMLYSTKKIRT